MKGPMLKNPRHPEAYAGAYLGCSCCNPKRVRRKGRHSAKRREARQWRRDQEA